MDRRIAPETEIAEFHDVQPAYLAAEEEAHSRFPSDQHPVYIEASSKKGRDRFHTVAECRHLLEIVRFPLKLLFSALLRSGRNHYSGRPAVFLRVALISERTVLTVFFVETDSADPLLAAGAALGSLSVWTSCYPGAVLIEPEVRRNVFRFPAGQVRVDDRHIISGNLLFQFRAAVRSVRNDRHILFLTSDCFHIWGLPHAKEIPTFIKYSKSEWMFIPQIILFVLGNLNFVSQILFQQALH